MTSLKYMVLLLLPLALFLLKIEENFSPLDNLIIWVDNIEMR